jgi:hypothetical protein
MIRERATAGLVSSTAGKGESEALASAALLGGENIGENIGEITSSKAKTKLALRCRGLNLSILILVYVEHATIVGRWGVCAAFQIPDSAQNRITLSLVLTFLQQLCPSTGQNNIHQSARCWTDFVPNM